MAIESQDGSPPRRPPLRAVEGGRDRRELPHSDEAEMSILGGVILRNELLVDLLTLEIDDFYNLRHKTVYQAMRALDARREPIDVTTLEVEIEKAGKLGAFGIDRSGCAAFLGELVQHVPTADNVYAYAKIVRDASMVRRAALVQGRMVERAYNWEEPADEFIGEAIADLQQIERGYREASERLPIITVAGALDELERLARTPVYETPFPALNGALGFGGLLGGQVYYLAGGTGFGKTSFITTIVKHHTQRERPAVIAFYEMFAAYYVARMTAGAIGVHSNAILRGEISRALIERSLPSYWIDFLDGPSMSILQRVAEKRVRANEGAPLIVVDYIQLLGDRILMTMSRPDARMAAAQASAGLRELAKSTGAAVLAVSAAGRHATKELAKDVRKKPARDLIGTARESGAIEFDGAGLIVLSVSDEKDGDLDIATISVAKARFGETTHIDARSNGRTGEWTSGARVASVIKVQPKPDDGSTRAAIVEALRIHGAPLSKSQIAERARKNKTAVMSEIDAMVTDGIARAAGRGFVLVDDASRSVPAPSQTELAEVR